MPDCQRRLRVISIAPFSRERQIPTMSTPDETAIGERSDQVGADVVPHLVHVFPSFDIGGQQVRLASIINHLAGKYRHTVVALNGNASARNLISIGEGFSVRILGQHQSRIPSPWSLHRFHTVMKQLNPTILLTYNWGSTEWAFVNRLALKRPHVHFEDGFGSDESIVRQLRRRILFRRAALGGVKTRIVVPSQQLFQLVTDRWAFRREAVVYIPNGIDCDRFSAAPDPELAARVNRRAGELIVGTIAALRPEKNLPRLIRSFAALPQPPQCRLVIAGDGPERLRLERIAQESSASARILFVGAIPTAEHALGLFDVFAVTSDTEQMPYTVLEAMAAGLPIVATDVGDISTMVATANRSFIVSLQDEPRFVQVLTTLIKDRSLRNTIGLLNRERVHREYDVYKMIATYDGLFESCRSLL
jgi:glycosyltransferase involved in cell wall biosynthesis